HYRVADRVLSVSWSLADGSTLNLLANLSAAPHPAGAMPSGRVLWGETAPGGVAPAWHVCWSIDEA
ncbi:MAG TPA: DUF3459 domain-containing protein, partial [Stellaceae bacterium]|nr:DUF3459 domain-containing protein [Stellaceae bacterium]